MNRPWGPPLSSCGGRGNRLSCNHSIPLRNEGVMAPLLVKLSTRNYRCLADLSLELRPINIFFGSNGSGKSTILDTIWFFRDCAINGVEHASANRGHGIGLVWEGAGDGEPLTVALASDVAEDNVSS